MLTGEEIVRQANVAIDGAVERVPGAEVYTRTVADRESVLCYLLRAVYVDGRRAGVGDAKAVIDESKRS